MFFGKVLKEILYIKKIFGYWIRILQKNTAQNVREMSRLTVLKEVLKLVMYAGKRGEYNIIITPKNVLNAKNSLRKTTLKNTKNNEQME